MILQLYNTLGRKKEEFSSLTPEKVKMYTCGPTVYDYQHIGNLRTYIFEDVLRRILEYNNYMVSHVMNITDVGHLTSDADSGEDKFMRTIRAENLSPTVESMQFLAKKYTSVFFQDCAKLNILLPTITCKASEHIADMINLIKRIEANGFTYQTSVGLIFDTHRYKSYSELGNLRLNKQKAGVRVNIDEMRKHPSDFALWITNQPNHVMQWDSPWGRGFPGWHIECSAMSMKYLGEQMDIHCGGMDHINVHHTNERAQSEAATGKKWVNYWIHGVFLVLDKEKMSKSTGHFICLSDIEAQSIDPLAYRYLCLSAHYRSPLLFSWKNLKSAQKAYLNLKNRINLIRQNQTFPRTDINTHYEQTFLEKINNDMDMPGALAIVWKMLKSDLSGNEKIELIKKFDQILGLDLLSVQELPTWASDKIKQREIARTEKNWHKADQIRDELRSQGILIEDTPDGPRWRYQ